MDDLFFCPLEPGSEVFPLCWHFEDLQKHEDISNAIRMKMHGLKGNRQLSIANSRPPDACHHTYC